MAPPHEADPRRGVFDTLLVHAGQPIALSDHLARLSASVRALYGTEPPASLASEARRAASGTELGRLRLTLRPGGSGLALEIAAAPVDAGIVFPQAGVELQGFALPGGLGPHKLLDRPPIERTPDGRGALLLDGDEVLEAGWANVFAVAGGVLRTPPLDGRILPGITRRAVIDVAGEAGLSLVEEPLSRADLLAAEEVFLTGSVRGVESAGGLDGATLAGAGELSRRVAAALRRRWRLPEPVAGPALVAAPRLGHSAR